MKRTPAFFALLALVLASPLLAAPVRMTGRVLAPGGKGAPAARVELFRVLSSYEEGARKLSGGPEPPPVASVQPRPDGSFEMTAPEEGLFRIAIRAEGYVPLEAARVPVVEETELPAAELERASPLQVRVIGADRKPAEGVSLCLSQTELDFSAMGSTVWEPVRCGTSGPGGALSLPQGKGGFRILMVTDPRFFAQSLQLQGEGPAELRLAARKLLTVEARGRDRRPRSGVLVSAGSIPLGLTGEDGRLVVAVPEEPVRLDLLSPDGQRADLSLQAGEPLGKAPRIVTLGPADTATGKVLDAATRAPLAKALVWTGGAHTWTGADGSFRLPVYEEPLPDQRVILEAAAAGHTWASEALKGRNPSATLLLAPASSISGRVVDAEGRPVTGAELRAVPSEPSSAEEMMATMTGAAASSLPDGSFRIKGLLPGRTYLVTASHEGFAPAEAPADSARPGQSAREVRIVLSRGVAAFGRVLDAEGAPVAAVELALLPAWEGGSIVEQPSLFNSGKIQTTSGATGAFRFSHLSPGRFHLRARRKGFAPGFVRGIEIPAKPARPGGVDLGEVRLEPGAVIEGQVTDERGTPVEGAMVVAIQDEPGALGLNEDALLTGMFEMPIQTGPEGRFRLEDLARGSRFDLTVLHAAYPKEEIAGVEAPTAEPLRIRLQPSRSLTGRVVDPEGRPVPGAEVSTVDLEIAASLGSVSGWNDESAETDEAGRFRLTGLAPGDVSLSVEAQGFRTKLVRRVRIPEDRDAPPLDISLERGETLEGRVLDARGNPVPGAVVSASREEEEEGNHFSFMSSTPHTETDGEGRYRLDGLETATYTVWAQSREEDQDTHASVEVKPGANRLDLTFPAGVEVSGRVVDEHGAPAPGARVVLQELETGNAKTTRSSADGSFRFPAVPDSRYSLSAASRGSATPSPKEVQISGAPVHGLELKMERGAVISGRLLGLPPGELAGVSVTALSFEPTELDEPLLNGVVDSQGRYRIPQVTPGRWQVTATLSSGREAEGEIEVAPGEEATLDLQFRGGVTLHGRALLDGEPVGGARVFLRTGNLASEEKPTSHGEARTSHDGTFAVPGLEPGEHTLTVALPGGLYHTRTLQVAADQPVLIEIATGVLAGRALSAEGLPVAGAEVFLGQIPPMDVPPSLPRAETDDQGMFEIPGVPAGSYEIVVQSDGHKPAPSQVMVPPGGRAQVEAVLTPEEPSDESEDQR